MFLLKIFKNKYFLTCVATIAWLLFFDKNDVFTQWELMKKCKKLENEKSYYITEIEKNRFFLNELQTNKNSLETFARESYLMKKDNEEVFVFVTK
jgi:cell division protein FtsB